MPSLFKRINPAEIPSRLTQYARDDVRADAVAGLTVAVMGVPQAMAYALIAGLPPVWGLYTAMVTCTVAAVLGSSRHLVTGPTNALCMVVLSLTAHLPEKYGLSLLEIVLLLTFLTGVIQLLFGLLRMGGVIRYVSHSVVIGFTAGAGILIAFNQLKNILGLHFHEHPERFHEVIWMTFKHLPETNFNALALGVITAVCVIVLPRINKRLPAALIGIVLAGGLAYFLGWYKPEMGASRVEIVRDIEPISSSLKLFRFPELLTPPPYELTRELGLGAMALAILGLIEAASIARAVASQSGQRLDFNREFIGQGAGNIVGSFFSSFAGSGSFTRTAVCYKSGGRTRMAAVFSALWTGLTILLFAGVANFIPKAALAGLLIVVAYTMVDKQHLLLTWRSGKHSRMVLFGTMASTLVLPLEYAIFVGVFLSIVILLQVTGRTDLTQLIPRDDAGFDEVPFTRAPQSEVVTVNMEGDLYFAAAEDLDYELLQCLTPKTRVVILRMKRLRAVGSTAMAILERFHALLEKRDIPLVVCGIEEDLKKVMTGSGLRKKIGEQNIFYADNKIFQSTELSLARAWSIVEMERRRMQAEEKTEARLDTSVTAGSILSPRILRFGNQHALREAVWLLVEMMKHRPQKLSHPIFLQDRDGRLDSGLTLRRVLRALAEALPDGELGNCSDEKLGELLRERFDIPIHEIARKNLPKLTREAKLDDVVLASRVDNIPTPPIVDEDGRLCGLLTSLDILRGLGQALDFNPEDELPKA